MENGNALETKSMKESEGLNNCECMNLVEDMDPIYAFHGETYTVTSEKLEKIKQKSRDVARIARLEMLITMDEESKENLRKEKIIQYSRRNKAPKAPQSDDSQPPPSKLTRLPFAFEYQPYSSINIS
jgi:hypothetical protein